MDPFSILGLAANVAQFIDFMLHILEIGNQVRRLGYTEDQLTLEAAATQIENESKRLVNETREREQSDLKLREQSANETNPLVKAAEVLDKQLIVLDEIEREELASVRKKQFASKSRPSGEDLRALDEKIAALKQTVRDPVAWNWQEKAQLVKDLRKQHERKELDIDSRKKELEAERLTIASKIRLLKEELERRLIEGAQDEHLSKIFVQCNQVAKKLTLKLRNSERKGLSKSQSIAEAIKLKFKSGEINGLVSQLEGYRKAIDSYVAEDTRNLVKAAIQRLDRVSQQSALYHKEVVALVNDRKENINKVQGTQSVTVNGSDASSEKQLNNALDLINVFLDQLRANKIITGLPSEVIKDYAVLNTDAARDQKLAEDQVLRALKFRTMVLREYNIHAAHAETFKWLLHESISSSGWDSLPSWLGSETEQGCYWVGAKAGSGKSTLLKYLAKSDDVAHMLRRWSEMNTLVIASHYFWMAGDEMQKNQSGLLRSLLHSILEVRRDLISVALPDLFDEVLQRTSTGQCPTDSDIQNSYATFELSELKIAFERIRRLNNKQVRICLIVDGLDEYVGDQQEMAKFFQSITSGSSIIKALVSSRPEPVFCSVFKDVPKLPLENFTRGDMIVYTEGLLGEHPNFKRMKEREPDEVQALCQAIVNKASGVFLWVKVVVHSVLQGLSDGNYLHELVELINQCPDELHDMFSHMFARMKSEHRTQASKYFQWVFRCIEVEGQPPTALRMSFMDTCKPSSVFDAPIFSMDMDEASDKICNVEMRIRSRCCGLLEVHNSGGDGASNPWDMVSLTHRSVLDHWRDNRSHRHRTMLESATKAVDFDPNEGLLSSLVFYLQERYIHEQNTQDRRMLTKLLDQFLQYLDAMGTRGETLQFAYLQELHRTLTWRWQNDRWYTLHKTSWLHLYLRQKGFDWELQPGTSYVLAFAVLTNMTGFVDQWIKWCPRAQVAPQVTPILRNLIKEIITDAETRLEYLGMFKLLTDAGESITEDDAGSDDLQDMLWQPLIEFSARSTARWSEDQFTAWVSMVALAIEAGVELDRAFTGCDQRTAREILRRRLETVSPDVRCSAPNISEIQDTLDQTAASDARTQQALETLQQAREAQQARRKNKKMAARQRKLAKFNTTCEARTGSAMETSMPNHAAPCGRCTAVDHLRQIGFPLDAIYGGLEHANAGNNVSAIVNWILLHQGDLESLRRNQGSDFGPVHVTPPVPQGPHPSIRDNALNTNANDRSKEQAPQRQPQHNPAWSQAVSKQTLQLARNKQRQLVVVGLDEPEPVVFPASPASAKNKRREAARTKRRQDR